MTRRLPLLLALAALVTGGCTSPERQTSESDREDSSFQAGRTLYMRGHHDSAQRIWEQSLGAATQQGDTAAIAQLLTWLGITAWRQSDYATARSLGERALELKQRHRLPERWRSWNALGTLTWNEGHLDSAAVLLESARRAAEEEGDDTGVASALSNLGLVRAEQGLLTDARGLFSLARDAGRVSGQRRLEGFALNNLAMVSNRLGDPLAALESAREARDIYRDEENPLGEENALGQSALAYDVLGEPQLALAAADSALHLSRQHGLRSEEVDNLRLLALLYEDAGDLNRASAMLAEARDIALDIGSELDAGITLREEARLDVRLGRGTDAVTKAETALRTHQRAGARFEVMLDHLLLAELHVTGGHRERAQKELALARAMQRTIGTATSQARVTLVTARLADLSGDVSGVLAALRGQQALVQRLGPNAEWEANSLLARAHARDGQLDSARSYGERAVGAVERVRGRLSSPTLRTRYVDERSHTYADLAIALLRSGDVAEAFRVADAARGRAILEHLSVARGRIEASSVADAREAEVLLRRIDDLLRRVSQADTSAPQERGSRPASPTGDLMVQVAAARSEYEAVLARASQSHPPALAVLGMRSSPAFDLGGVLGDREALVSYLVADDRLLTFVVRENGVRSFEQPASAVELARRVRLARELLARPGSGEASNDVLSALWETLIRTPLEAGALDGVGRLVIVAHGPLDALPFAALRDPDGGRWLAERYSLLHVPSARALAALRTRPQPAQLASTATSRRSTILAPFDRSLPASVLEARAVRRSLRTSVTLTGSRASERELRAALRRGGIVHVATHGVLNVHNPMFSRIALSRGDGSAADDGRLEVHEIISLTVSSPLVFLSGCETGLGGAWSTGFGRGEDFTTLAQAFLLAGAETVAGTLWRISDAAAAEFASRFYEALRRHAPPEALAEAQRQMMRDPSLSDPYFWAGYEIAGRGSRVH